MSLVQCGISFNKTRGTIRGMHYQNVPYQETKLVSCLRGRLYDVAVDLRPTSETYCKWFAVELDEEDGKSICIPEGFAHGFQTLEDDAMVYYQISEFYHPDYTDGVRWNDPVFGIYWPIECTNMSERDRNFQDYYKRSV